ncbi:MAG: biopolymer transporter ExbD [Bdellovibrionaceae bacterium]|nr:biopolymer transporter ExbD [Pseudobdellovibrionaceae bacterium]
MSKRRNITIESRNQEDANFELDLSPMLSLMVTLIPIMLLSTVFVRITLIETPLPQVVQNAIENDKNNKDREVNLVLNMTQEGFKFEVLIDGKLNKTTRIPKLNNQWDLNSLYVLAHELKMTHPQIFKMDIKPDSDIKYNDIVKVMDELRIIKKGDSKAVVTDSETTQKAETELMFPEINFANVVEG